MYKVCIADDEAMIQKSIAARLQAAGAGLQLKGCAGNGEEALGLYWLMKPDIYFVDINMPGMTGLQFIRKVREDDPHTTTKFIIISGYSDFPHVQEAIKIGVMDYIKKPISSEEFSEVVQSAIRALEAERARRGDIERRSNAVYYEDYLAGSAGKKLRGSLLALYSAGEPHAGDDDAFQQALAAAGGKPTALAVRGAPALRLYYLDAVQTGKDGLQQLAACLPVQKRPFLVWAHPQGEELPHWANLLEQSLNLRFLPGAPLVAECAAAAQRPALDTEMLDYALERGKAAAAEKAIRGYMDTAMESREGAMGLSLLHRQIVLLIINKYVQRYLQIPEGLKNEITLFATCRYPDVEAMAQRLGSMAATLAATVEEASRGSELIQSVCGWLEQNYMGNVTLNELASQFYVSAPYLSRRFKEKKGQTLFQYLEDIRVEKAREYLEQSEAQIVDISARVGYTDPNYFAKVFKKKYGRSPSEYRGRR